MKRNFPSFIDAFLEFNQDLGLSQRFLLWSAISGVAACLERKVWCQKALYPNMFIMLTAGPGIGKSRASKQIISLLDDVEGVSQAPTQITPAALIKFLSEVGNAKQFNYKGKSFKNSSVFSYSSEAASTIGDVKGFSGFQEILTDLYDNGKLEGWSQNPGWNKETLGGGKTPIYNPCLNLLYCSTPDWLMKCLGKSGIAGGFASRIIFVNEKKGISSTGWVEEDNSSVNDEMRTKLVEDLRAINKLSGRFEVDEGFKAVYSNISKDSELRTLEGGVMSHYFNRKPMHFTKLCMILSAQESDKLLITQDHAMAAADLLTELEPSMYEPFGLQGENKNLTALNACWNLIKTREHWTEKNLIGTCYRHASPKDIMEFMKVLRSKDKVRAYAIEGGIAYQVIDPTSL